MAGIDEKRVTHIAVVAHEANRAYCRALEDYTQMPWQYAPAWQRESAVAGVRFCIASPDAPPSANHDAWHAEKQRTGWKYGPVKDEVKKTHPCMVPYEKLPLEQRRKDGLFKAVVAALCAE